MIEDEELRRTCAGNAAETAHRWTMPVIGPRWERLFDELTGYAAGGEADGGVAAEAAVGSR
jgi:hypothetical protein